MAGSATRTNRCCVDYVGRLQRSLAGEIAPDRYYFLEKAHELQYWATNLVQRCEEIEGWVAEGSGKNRKGV